MSVGGSLGNVGNWVTDNPFTIGGAIGGGYFGGPLGGIAGAGIGSAIDRSDDPSAHQIFMANTGLMEPGPFQPYTSTPGMTPTSGGGYSGAANFMTPGAGEIAAGNVGAWSPQQAQGAWGDFAGTFYGPTRTEAYTGEALSNMPGSPRTTQYTEDEYLRLRGVDPGLGPANLDAYFDNAKRRAAESINREAAARGSYAASTSTDRLGEAFTNLEAEKALREADYNLRRAAENRQWEGLKSSAAGAADVGTVRNAAAEMAWMEGMADLAQAGDEAERQRALDAITINFGLDEQQANWLMDQLQAGTIGQGLEQGRTLDLFESMMGLGDEISGIMGEEYEGMFGQDMDFMNKIMEWASGEPALAASQDYRRQEVGARDLGMLYDIGKDQQWW